MTVANAALQLGDSPLKIASTLTGKVIRYLNQNPSTVTKDGVRTFRVQEVEDIFISKSSGKQCAVVRVQDVDDAGTSKHRTLHLSGISAIV
jgi:hypothetical protein